MCVCLLSRRLYQHLWRKPGWNDAPRNGWKSRVATSPNGEYNGENYAIHEGDDGEVEADWFVGRGV